MSQFEDVVGMVTDEICKEIEAKVNANKEEGSAIAIGYFSAALNAFWAMLHALIDDHVYQSHLENN